MEFLDKCRKQLVYLYDRLDQLLSVPYSKRDADMIRVVSESIENLEFALAEFQLGLRF